jgi:hypothetical protein
MHILVIYPYGLVRNPYGSWCETTHGTAIRTDPYKPVRARTEVRTAPRTKPVRGSVRNPYVAGPPGWPAGSPGRSVQPAGRPTGVRRAPPPPQGRLLRLLLLLRPLLGRRALPRFWVSRVGFPYKLGFRHVFSPQDLSIAGTVPVL